MRDVQSLNVRVALAPSRSLLIPSRNDSDCEDEDGTRSPKRRKMSKELDGDIVCLNLNTGEVEKERDMDMEVEMHCGEEGPGWQV
jgi:hypothetical protein